MYVCVCTYIYIYIRLEPLTSNPSSMDEEDVQRMEADD